MENFNLDSIDDVTRKNSMRSSIRNGATLAAKKFGSKALTRGVTTMAKANPAFIAGDVMELGVEAFSGSKNAGRAASAAVYLTAGAAVGGPVGAGVAAAVWGVGQAIDYIIGGSNHDNQ